MNNIINIIDRDFNFLGQIDNYESLIMTKKWHGIGGFELHLHENNIYTDKLIKGNIIAKSKQEKAIEPIGESIEIIEDWRGKHNNTKIENGTLKLIDKNIWRDGSGNGNDGQLMNFNFTEDSGWGDGGLRFDGVDDYIQLPELNLDLNNFTLQVDNKIRVFNGDKVITENMEDIAYTWKQFEGMTWEEVINL